MGGVWSQTVSADPDCQIAIVCDPEPEAAAEKADLNEARAVTDPQAVFDSPEVDIVLICTPTFTHVDLVEQAARAGKHVLCEKPMALNLADCSRMIEACDRAGVCLAVGQTLRFWGAFLRVRELVAEGAIGTPCMGQVHRMGMAGVRRPDRTPRPPTEEERRWRYDTQYSGGNILEGVVHELDFTRSLFGEVRSLYCQVTGGEEYDGLLSPIVVQAVMDFEAGGLATVRMGGVVAYPCQGSWIGGTEGTLAFDGWEGPVLHHVPGADAPHRIECEKTDAYSLELRDLVGGIDAGAEMENSGVNGMKNIALGLAMYRSIEQACRLEFENGLPTDLPLDYQYRGPNAVK